MCGPIRASVLRNLHYYPFLAPTALLEWTEAAIQGLVERFFPTPEEPILSISQTGQTPPSSLRVDFTSAPVIDIFYSPPTGECCQWWAPLKAHSCENVTDPVTFFQKMSCRGYILFRIHFKSIFFKVIGILFRSNFKHH